MRPILAYACPVWGYAAKTNINILDTLQNSLIRMIVKAIRYMRNDDILQTPKRKRLFNAYDEGERILEKAQLVTPCQIVAYCSTRLPAKKTARRRSFLKYDACRRQIYRPISAKRIRRTTAQHVANQFLAASGKQISRKTVDRRLRGGGLYARRPVVCVPLTRQHHTARLHWCREHHNWTEQDWACVLFSDESRFSLSSDCRRQLIWRESGTAYRPENIQEKDRYPTCSIMVWAGIMINGRTRLHVVANGTMTGQRYIDEVLLPHDCLDSEGIQRLVWPVRSPDLNPIENAWDALGRQVPGRNYSLTNKNILIRALTEEWDKLPQQLLANVVQSMVRRVECCITLHGGHIPY
ncbi:transposable element Tcb1 transposase [Trichonephila clavipes]|nr:transposable element Tcb1 transposase [Trichonephila clavipes]